MHKRSKKDKEVLIIDDSCDSSTKSVSKLGASA